MLQAVEDWATHNRVARREQQSAMKHNAEVGQLQSRLAARGGEKAKREADAATEMLLREINCLFVENR